MELPKLIKMLEDLIQSRASDVPPRTPEQRWYEKGVTEGYRRAWEWAKRPESSLSTEQQGSLLAAVSASLDRANARGAAAQQANIEAGAFLPPGSKE